MVAGNLAAICRQCCCHMPATLLAAADYEINQLLHADRYGFFDYFTCLQWIIKQSNYGLKA